MARLELVRIDKDGKETILEITPVPESFIGGSIFHSSEHIKKLEAHYKRTGKPKRSYVDAIYIIRRQVERE